MAVGIMIGVLIGVVSTLFSIWLTDKILESWNS